MRDYVKITQNPARRIVPASRAGFPLQIAAARLATISLDRRARTQGAQGLPSR
jgi:hypothetical protein